jgi:hypothetical protein
MDSNAQKSSPTADALFEIGDGEDSDNGASIISEISTIEYDQEPYETYQQKTAQLMLDHFPGYRTEDVKIERMEATTASSASLCTSLNQSILGTLLRVFGRCSNHVSRADNQSVQRR